MASEMSAEARIAFLEAEVARLRKAEDLRRKIHQIELTVEKVREKDPSAVTAARKSVCLSSACTSVCFSSVSSIRVNVADMATHDPELAEVFGILQEKATQVLGAEGTVDALIARAKSGDVAEL
jgi:hypothetical protein